MATLSLAGTELGEFNELVASLYRCLHENSGFTSFFDNFCRVFRAAQGGILGLSKTPQRMVYGWTFGYPEGFEEWFINSDLPERDEALCHYVKLPPRRFDSLLGGDATRSLLDVLGPETRVWVEQAGLGDSAGMRIAEENGLNVVFIANRHRDHGVYSHKELKLMNLLAPHISNAVALYLKLYQSRSDNESLAMALNHVAKPLIVFNALGSVTQINDAARATLSATGGLYVGEDQRLHSHDRRFTRKLQDTITTCIVHSHRGKIDTHTLFMTRANARLAICLTPLVSGDAGNSGVLAELFSFDTNPQPDLARLQQLFQCTPTEAEIAAALMTGLGATAISEQKRISVHTARQHIKSLLGKNGCRKQTELVAMLVRALG